MTVTTVSAVHQEPISSSLNFSPYISPFFRYPSLRSLISSPQTQESPPLIFDQSRMGDSLSFSSSLRTFSANAKGPPSFWQNTLCNIEASGGVCHDLSCRENHIALFVTIGALFRCTEFCPIP
ncbi:hypothetical protein BT69DRAFT_747574 [Atractiella rhizophila]|nr:hypothetical protein BT69DRAFT_747574 [Atractiella rhizophila]